MTPGRHRYNAQDVEQLRATIAELRAKLARESREREQYGQAANESKAAAPRIAQRLGKLRKRGLLLADQISRALSKLEARGRRRDRTMLKMGELRLELSRRTEELRRRSARLARLAKKSAARAREIIGQAPRRIKTHRSKQAAREGRKRGRREH